MRYSKQREQIMDAVVSNAQHPTADQIYKSVRRDNPNISLGTVYRNLNQLTEAGELLRIPIYGNKDRFDHNTRVHFHLQCASCGAFVDLPEDVSGDIVRLMNRIHKQTGMTVAPESMQFQGICHACESNQNKVTVEEH
ncbi:MAG TPA: transcriptional repressor [Clostridiales bacterium]|nr:transcriptional repressor [Clostridiales bacterium]